MTLPVAKILWSPTNSAHYNHLHVEAQPVRTGTPPSSNPGMTPNLRVIFDALKAEFGTVKYFLDDGDADWTYMGYYNRRKIAGTDIWSQHAYANAIDIGPYYGVIEQLPFYTFLTGEDMPTPREIARAVWDEPAKPGTKPSGQLLLEARYWARRAADQTEPKDIKAIIADLNLPDATADEIANRLANTT